jgi:hypothetical protein
MISKMATLKRTYSKRFTSGKLVRVFGDEGETALITDGERDERVLWSDLEVAS